MRGHVLERIFVLLLSLDLVGGTQLLHRAGVQPHAFFQFGGNDQALSLELRHFRLHVPLTANRQRVGAHHAAVVAQHPGQCVPEGGLAVRAVAVGNDEGFREHLADDGHAHDGLHIIDQFRVVAEYAADGIQPQILSGIAGGSVGALGQVIQRIMLLRSVQPLTQIVGSFRCVQQVRVYIQLVDVHQHQGLGLVQTGHDVLVIAVLHDEGVILQGRHVGHEQLQLIVAGHSLRQRFAACSHILLRHTAVQQRLLCRRNLILRVLQLQIKELHHGPDGHLLGFLPVDAVVADEIRAVGESKLVAVFPRQHLGFTDVGIIAGLQAHEFLGVVLIRRHIAVLFADLLLVPADGAGPDCGELFVIQRRLALRRLVHENLMGFVRIAVPDDDPARKLGHGLVPCARDDDVADAPRIVPFYRSADLNLAVNGQPAFMPDGVTHIRAEDEPGGIQGVVIEEGVFPVDGFLERRVVIRVLRGLDLKVHMELGPGCLAVLLQHVMPAEGDGVADIRHHLVQLFRRDPLRRVFRVVVVAVHDENIGLTEVLLAAVVIVILRAHVIHLDGFLKLLGAGDLRPVRIEAVLLIADDVRRLQNQLHACTSNLCLFPGS